MLTTAASDEAFLGFALVLVLSAAVLVVELFDGFSRVRNVERLLTSVIYSRVPSDLT